MPVKNATGEQVRLVASSDGVRWSAYPAGDKPSGRPSFTTTFPADENPISQGGQWARSTSLDLWEPMVTLGGRFYGTNGPDNAYDDAFARRVGATGDYTVTFTVRVDAGLNTAVTHEIEVNRLVENPDGTVVGIEMLFHFSGFTQCFLWDHAATGATAGSFTEVASGGGSSGGNFVTGDICRVVFSGTTATCQKWNGSGWDTLGIYTHARNAQNEIAIGGFTRPGGDMANFAITSLTMTPT